MTESVPTSLLRRALILDATASGAMAALLVLGASLLTGAFGLSAGFLRGVGLLLVPWVALLVWAAQRPRIAKALVVAIVASNLAWVGASAWILMGGLVSPTTLGTSFVIAQAVAVAIFADLQVMGLRQNRSVVA
jgi:hypothetical protein